MKPLQKKCAVLASVITNEVVMRASGTNLVNRALEQFSNRKPGSVIDGTPDVINALNAHQKYLNKRLANIHFQSSIATNVLGGLILANLISVPHTDNPIRPILACLPPVAALTFSEIRQRQVTSRLKNVQGALNLLNK